MRRVAVPSLIVFAISLSGCGGQTASESTPATAGAPPTTEAAAPPRIEDEVLRAHTTMKKAWNEKNATLWCSLLTLEARIEEQGDEDSCSAHWAYMFENDIQRVSGINELYQRPTPGPSSVVMQDDETRAVLVFPGGEGDAIEYVLQDGKWLSSTGSRGGTVK